MRKGFVVLITALLLSALAAEEVSAQTSIGSCTKISSPGVYVLNTSIINSSATRCIEINVSNVVFDGAEYTIDGTDTGSTYGFYVYNSAAALTNITLKNTIVTDWAYGIYYRNSQNGSITNSTVSSNSRGMYVYSSSGNTVASNTVSSNTDDGIHLEPSSSSNTVTNNTVSSNTNYGIFVKSSSNNNTLTNNTLSSNSRGIFIESSSSNTVANNTANSNSYGIYLYTSSTTNTVTNNTANSNTNYGIYLSGSSSNTVASNMASSNSYGIYLSGSSSNNTLINNTASSNTYEGVHLGSSSSNSTLTNNTASSNGDGGIYISSSSNALTSNNASSNVGKGIAIYSSSNNTLTSNIANSNSGIGTEGIELSSSSNNVLINNIANFNADEGIDLDGVSNNNTLINNTANSNDKGIESSSGSNNTLINNTANSNTNYGIYLSSSSSNNNTLINNTANSNNYGIYLYSSSSNTVASNTANSNSRGIYLSSSGNNTIYNNRFNNTINYYATGTIYGNTWNTTKTLGTNIVGGPYFGGNFWAYPNGTGFSQTCTDGDGDGICDSSYALASGNVDYLPLTLFTDTTAPAITFVNPTPANNSNVTVNYAFINVSVVDVASSVDSAVLSWNGTNESMTKVGTGTNLSFYVNKTGLSDGNYTYRVYANDSAGNMNVSETRTLTILIIDTTSPAVIIYSPANNAIISGNQTIKANVSDADPGISSVYANVSNTTSSTIYTMSLVEGTIYNGNWSNTTWDTTRLADGVYNVTINATDSAGNSNATEHVSVVIDNVYPVVTFVSPTLSNGSITDNNWIYVNTTASEQDIANAYLEWDNSSIGGGVSNVTISCTLENCYYNYSLSAQTIYYAGSYRFRVWVNDSAGNLNFTERRTVTVKGRFTVDPVDLAPSSISAPAYNVTMLKLNLTAYGENVTISNITVTKVGNYHYTLVNVSLYWDRHYNVTQSNGTSLETAFNAVKLTNPTTFGSNSKVSFTSFLQAIQVNVSQPYDIVIVYDIA